MYQALQIFLSLALESFPISSSGHILLLSSLCYTSGVCSDMITIPSWLEHFVHLPIACVIALFFFTSWWPLVCNPLRYRSWLYRLCAWGFVVELITVAWYVLFALIGTAWFSVSAGFMITALLCASVAYAGSRDCSNLSWKNACVLGMGQGVALLPGISRFGTTYVLARWCGFKPRRAFELSFMIEFPISVAGGLRGAWDMQRAHAVFTVPELWALVLGSVCMFLGLHSMKRIIDNDQFKLFSWYMIVIAFISLLIM